MYLDSAIIVKLLVAEPDSPIFVAATKNLPIASSELAFTEVAAALFKKQREKSSPLLSASVPGIPSSVGPIPKSLVYIL